MNPITYTIHGVTFETKIVPAKNTFEGRMVYKVDGKRVSMNTFAAEQEAARVLEWKALLQAEREAV